MRPREVFVDTSAWVALVDLGDGLHHDASLCWQNLLADGRTFVTSDYILDESYTLLRRRRNGLRMATLLRDLVVGSDLITELEVDSAVRAHGWEIFTGYDDKVLSFTDCTSFALMRDRTLLEAFTLDSDFKRAGFIVLPG